MRPLANWRTFETPDYIELQRGESILAIEKCTRKFGCTVPLVPLLAVATVPFGLATAGLALFVGLAIAILIWLHGEGSSTSSRADASSREADC